VSGKAGDLLVTLDPSATVDDILAKFDSVYGQIDGETDVLASFYTAQQGHNETVVDWSCRIEGLFARAQRMTNITGTEEGLRQMFWTGLQQPLKTASLYYYETVKPFDELRKAVRKVEQQQAEAKVEKKVSCQAAQDTKANASKDNMETPYGDGAAADFRAESHES
jgi:hypothetical protein